MSKRVIEMLNNHIEFAEKTSKLHDVGNFELIKATIEKQAKEIEELKNYQLHAQDDLTAKDKELAESIPISAIEKILDEWQINIDCADHYVIGSIWKICKREIEQLIKDRG